MVLVKMERRDFLANNSSLCAVDTTSLSAKVYERLLTAIVRKEIKAGQSLEVDKLAASFGVSRTPVQTAIARLAELGLVVIKPRKGTFVAKLTADDVHELFELRLLIEVHAVKKGTQSVTDDEVMALSQIVHELSDFFSGDHYIDYHAFLERDREFHAAIVKMVKNRRLEASYDQARVLIEVVRASAGKHIGGAALSQERHMQIVEALKSRDTEKAVSVIEKHIQASELAVLSRLQFP